MANIGRILKIIFGVFFILLGLSLLLGGTVVLAINYTLTDEGGYFQTDTIHISENNVSILRIDIPTEVDISQPDIDIDLSKIIRFKIKSDDPVHLGILKRSDAVTYTEHVNSFVITDINFENEFIFDFEDTNNFYSGSFVPATNYTGTLPNDAEFNWILNPENSTLFRWNPQLEDFQEPLSIILYDLDDDITNLDVGFSFGVAIPLLEIIGWVLFVFGGLFTFIAIILFWSAIKTKERAPKRVRYYQGAPVQPIESTTQSGEIQCSNCGTIIPSDSNFCANCGEVLLYEDKTITEKTTAPQPEVLVVADWGERFWAYIIDWILVSLITNTLTALFLLNSVTVWQRDLTFIFFTGPPTFVFFIYTWLMEAFYHGQTVGKLVLNLQIVTVGEGTTPDIGKLLITSLGRSAFIVLDMIIGFIIESDEDQIPVLNQRFSQRLTNTVVIEKPIQENASNVRFVSSKVK